MYVSLMIRVSLRNAVNIEYTAAFGNFTNISEVFTDMTK